MLATMQFRRARPTDRTRILSLLAAAASEDAVPDGDADEERVMATLLGEAVPDLDRLIAAGRYFVAASGDEVVAGAGWAPQLSPGGVAFIRGLTMGSGHRDGALARRLIEIVEDAAVTAGYDVILAPVPAASADLFAALGYRASGAVEIEVAAGHRLQRRKMWKHAA